MAVTNMLQAVTSQRHRRANFTSRSDSRQFGWGSKRIPSQNKSRHNLFDRLTALKYVHTWNSETIAPAKAQVSVVPEIKQETWKINTRICQKVKWSGRWQVHSHKPPTTQYIQPIRHASLLTLVSFGGITFWLVCPFGMRSGFNDNRASISIWNRQKSYTVQSGATAVKLHKYVNTSSSDSEKTQCIQRFPHGCTKMFETT
jgi:hypothetical protein